MPKASYFGAAKAFEQASSLGALAEQEAYRRNVSNRLGEMRSEARQNMFNTLAQAVGIGSTLYENIKSNRELIEFAKSEGFEPVTNRFTNVFGAPKFKLSEENIMQRIKKGGYRGGESKMEFGREHILGLQYLQQMQGGGNLMDLLFSTQDMASRQPGFQTSILKKGKALSKPKFSARSNNLYGRRSI